MRLPYSVELALRLLRGGAGSILRTSSAVAVFGLALGVTALVVAMGLMTGYREDLAEALVTTNAEVLMYAEYGSSIEAPEPLRESVRRVPGVASAAPVVLQPSFAFGSGGADPTADAPEARGAAAMVKGLDPEDGLPKTLALRAPEIAALPPHRPGELPAAVVGRRLAASLGLRAGDPFRLLLPDLSGRGAPPRSATFRMTATFETGFPQYDGEWVFTRREAARRALRLGSAATGIEVRAVPGADLDRLVERLRAVSPRGVRVVDWRSLNRPLFAALALQQRALFVALALIVGVAAFNLASSLRTLALGRTRDVGLLIACGASRAFVGRVFLWCGALLGGIGTAAGLALGSALCLVLTATRAVRFPEELAEVYFVDWIPFRPDLADLALTGAVAVALAIVASVMPARRAAAQQPAAALRYE